MHDAIETFEQDGWRAEIFYDENPTSPADWTTVGTLAYRTRDAAVGDLPSDAYGGVFVDDCPVCDGAGEWYLENEDGTRSDETETCSHCKGECYVADGAQLAKRLHDAVVCLPVYAVDGRMGTQLSVADDWDEANGWIYATAASIAETMGEDATPEQVADALKQELETWEQWAQGDVYGYVVTDPSGNVADSCWGFYGLDDAEAEANASFEACIADEAEQVKKIEGMMRV